MLKFFIIIVIYFVIRSVNHYRTVIILANKLHNNNLHAFQYTVVPAEENREKDKDRDRERRR